jgi:hypothetical protein
MDGLHVSQMSDAVGLAPGGEFPCGLAVGFPGVRVPDVDRKEFENTPGGAGVGREKGWQDGSVALALDSGAWDYAKFGWQVGGLLVMYDNVLYHA